MSILKGKRKSNFQSELVKELYRKVSELETIILNDNNMKRELLDIFQKNNYNNKDLIIRKLKSILDRYIDPESEANNVN